MINTRYVSDVPHLMVLDNSYAGVSSLIGQLSNTSDTDESGDSTSDRGSRGVTVTCSVTDAREVVTNFKVTRQCPCKIDECSATGRTLKGSGHNKGCICEHCQSGVTTVARQPIRKTAKAGKKQREGRLKEGTVAYDAERAIVAERSGGLCQLKLSEYCTGIAQGAHHVKSRARGGSDYARNLLSACNICNTWVEDNPLEAHAKGFAKHSWEDES